uniref:DUF4005 domain-containing protein n=1 Tax=Oryza nivara TaxID=4536 RepID=A0A0E0FW18_ORYNI
MGARAKKVLRALKALVKLQALVRGFLVRRQAAAMLQSMQALIRAHATVRAHCIGADAAAHLPHIHHAPFWPRRSLVRRWRNLADDITMYIFAVLVLFDLDVVCWRWMQQERCATDDTRSEHGVAAYSRRLSTSIESSPGRRWCRARRATRTRRRSSGHSRVCRRSSSLRAPKPPLPPFRRLCCICRSPCRVVIVTNHGDRIWRPRCPRRRHGCLTVVRRVERARACRWRGEREFELVVLCHTELDATDTVALRLGVRRGGERRPDLRRERERERGKATPPGMGEAALPPVSE